MDKPFEVWLAEIADQLRSIAQNGMHYSRNDYDTARYERIQVLAAELIAATDGRPTPVIAQQIRQQLGVRTPHVGADAAIFDDVGRLLLVQRPDSGMWCMPGGTCEVGESPSVAAAREAREETGLTVLPTYLVGVFDTHTLGVPSGIGQAYSLVFACKVEGGILTTTNETSAAQWVTEPEAQTLPLWRGHVKKVPAAFAYEGGAATFH